MAIIRFTKASSEASLRSSHDLTNGSSYDLIFTLSVLLREEFQNTADGQTDQAVVKAQGGKVLNVLNVGEPVVFTDLDKFFVFGHTWRCHM